MRDPLILLAGLAIVGGGMFYWVHRAAHAPAGRHVARGWKSGELEGLRTPEDGMEAFWPGILPDVITGLTVAPYVASQTAVRATCEAPGCHGFARHEVTVYTGSHSIERVGAPSDTVGTTRLFCSTHAEVFV